MRCEIVKYSRKIAYGDSKTSQGDRRLVERLCVVTLFVVGFNLLVISCYFVGLLVFRVYNSYNKTN